MQKSLQLIPILKELKIIAFILKPGFSHLKKIERIGMIGSTRSSTVFLGPTREFWRETRMPMKASQEGWAGRGGGVHVPLFLIKIYSYSLVPQN